MKKSGFTLVELLVIICIIGVLCALTIPAFVAVREAIEQQKVEELSMRLNQPITGIFTCKNKYPISWDGKEYMLVDLRSPDNSVIVACCWGKNEIAKYAQFEINGNYTVILGRKIKVKNDIFHIVDDVKEINLPKIEAVPVEKE